jgi:signal transduction histidine kinase
MNTLFYNDALDTRLVFRVYAIVAWTAGGFLYGWGGFLSLVPLAGVPHSDWMAARIAGAVLAGAGFLAIAMARSHDDDARRRALGWWAVAHAVVLVGVALQLWAIIGFAHWERGGLVAMGFLLGVSTLFAQFWQTADGIPWAGLGNQSHPSVLEDLRRPTVRRLRSTYEEKIREAAGQEERHHLARDLHDSVKQQIFVMHTAAATAQARFESDPAGARVAVEQVRSSAREAMAELEAMLDQLRASPIENTGLVELLRKQCEALRFRTGAEVQFTLGELPPSETLMVCAQQALYRVAQEALANVGRHARATRVTVTLDSSPISVQLRVDDNGVGFDTGHASCGMGLGNMRARVEALGGILAVTSEPGKGTLVRVSLPHAPAEAVSLAARRRRVLFWGGMCVLWLSMVIWASAFGRAPETRFDVMLWTVFLAFHCSVFARVTQTYLRARKSAPASTGNGPAS